MKSSSATTSESEVSSGPSAVLPVVIRTRKMESVKVTPRNDSPLLKAGTANDPSEAFNASKNSNCVTFIRSTSVNTAPNPNTVAGVLVPGSKKNTSVTLLPSGANSRGMLNVSKLDGYCELMSPNSGDDWPLISKPVPGVVKTAPLVVGSELNVVIV